MDNFKEINQKDLMNVVGGGKAAGLIVEYVVGKIIPTDEITLIINLTKEITSEPPAHAYYTAPAGYNGGGTAPGGASASLMIS